MIKLMKYYDNVAAFAEESGKHTPVKVCAVVSGKVGGKEVQLVCGYGSVSISDAAEDAACRLVLRHGIDVSEIRAIVYWADGAVFGPFSLVVRISAEAQGLRGGDK